MAINGGFVCCKLLVVEAELELKRFRREAKFKTRGKCDRGIDPIDPMKLVKSGKGNIPTQQLSYRSHQLLPEYCFNKAYEISELLGGKQASMAANLQIISRFEFPRFLESYFHIILEA